jgi:hypothetical protein
MVHNLAFGDNTLGNPGLSQARSPGNESWPPIRQAFEIISHELQAPLA